MASSAKPLAVCVGMGVALLASVSLGRRHQRVWQSVQRLAASSCGVATATAASEPGAARLLQCAQQLQVVGADSLSGKTITVVQVRARTLWLVCAQGGHLVAHWRRFFFL